MYNKMMIFGWICFLLSLGTAWGTTLHVPAAYPTIQSAIDAAASGDEVLVARGTYEESISIVGKHLTLRSSDGPNMTAIWGGYDPTTVVYVHSNWGGPATHIEGFEITSKWGSHDVSGITCVECSMNVVNCVVHGCHQHGVECYEAFVDMINTQVVDNEGGPRVYGNTADFNIMNCTIADNYSYGNGGGIFLVGAIYFSKIKNSIFWNNRSLNSFPGEQIWVESSGYLEISFSDVQDGILGAVATTGSHLTWGGGMIQADPHFMNPYDDFHLRATSPCIDAGDGLGALLLDFENDPRSGVDMGADEFHLHLYQYGFLLPGGHFNIKIVGEPDVSPVILLIGSGIQNPPLTTKYGDLFLVHPLYFLYFNPLAYYGFLNIIADAPVYLVPGTEFYLQSFVQDKLSNLAVITVR